MADYDLNTESINSFVEDSQIELPRFQRKLTWTDEDNFKLCLSVFKGYPLGVIVLSKDENKKYLLDGRQRRHALDEMRNPEKIYDWAKSAIGFYVKDSEDELRSQYWDFVDQYFGEEEEEEKEEGESSREAGEASLKSEENFTTSSSNSGKQSQKSQEQSIHKEDKNIKQLLNIILMVHEKRGRTSGLTKPFDFKKYVDGLDYISTTSGGRRYVDTPQLLDWIDYRSNGRGTPDLEYFDQDTFYNWLMQGKVAGEGDNSKENTIRKHIDRNWDQIVEALTQLKTLNTILGNRKLGYLEVRDVTANDEKKIFEIINSEGTDLTAVEILSAKPAYNQEIENPSQKLTEAIEHLYEEEMGVKQKNAVRWDRPATFYERLTTDSILPTNGYGFERRVRIGFKIMSGYYLGGISRNHFEELSNRDDINWGSTELEESMNKMEDILTDHRLLKFWNEWDDPLIRMSSEAVAINYLLCMMKYWKELGEPRSKQASKLEKFQNKGAVFFDRLIYEYVTRLWRGSSDSRIANNLKNVSEESSLFDPVDTENWKSLLQDLINNGLIEGQTQLDNQNPTNEVKLLLRYFYVLQGKRPTNPGNVSVDHIIPQSDFESTPQEELKQYKHHIANLAEIPHKDNASKGSKSLSQIRDPWLKSQVEEYTGIDQTDFDKYDNVTDIHDLIDYRGEKIINRFIEGRKEMLKIQ